ncbi:VCBS domain-containing protein [Shewanella aegiceratis]|uniref:VCBS domain-containing protein n=1 Tax=Shewanella aegiceratis TaxID=2864203 RepID=UPI001C65850A|nr:VCBS domain-containing protein [Shewanella aegiceratis]QYJ82931.1 VCBS domain-containing protein [Shewanella aegiceratis]
METSKGQYGDLVLNPSTGEWHYHLNNFDAKTNALFEGEHHNETFTITATDNLGNRVSSVICVAVEGSNDLPVISGVHHASLNELGSVDRVSGQLIATDPDTGDGVHWAVPHSSGVYGELVIDPDTGVWQYRIDNSSPNTLALHAGQVATETFRVTATDSSGQPVSQIVTIEVHGADQRAIIHGMASGSVTEDRDLVAGQLQTSGQLTVIDPDDGDAHFIATTLQGQYGTLTINDLGHWTYTADNSQSAIQGLKSGESLTETLFVHSIDGSDQKVTVTINGTDDRAVIGATTGAVTEDKDLYQGLLRVDGALTVTDADHGEEQFVATSLQGQYGTLTINNLGHWTYTADNSQAAIQGLKSGESLTETLFVHSVDGTEQKVIVTINGTDDRAVIGGTATGTVTEDKDLYQGQLRVDGALTVIDADHGEAQFVATSLQGQYGTLTINDLGHWTYIADNSQAPIQGLKSGESLTETLFVHSIDGTEQKVTVTINGTDDKAVIGGASMGAVTEDKDLYQGQLRVDGALSVTDADHGESQFVATSLQGQYGTLTINNLGHWTYTADNSQAAIQGLKSGESLTETLFVHSIDGTEQKVTVSINGTDDKAVIGGASMGTVTEDKDLYQGQLRVDGALRVTDADHGEAQFIATSLQGQFGTLTINSLGHWTYTADNAQTTIQGLKSGESLTETLFVHSIDGTEQKVIVTINGTDDKAVIGGAATGAVTEDRDLNQGLLRVDGALTVTDADHGEAQFVATSLQGQYGTLTINDLGHWTYTADNSQVAIQGLKSGESLTETLYVHSVDGTEQKVTVSINGTDDKAVIGGTATGIVNEDKDLYQGQLRVDGALMVTDADHGEAQFVATSLRGQYGTLTINDLGHWTYTADNSQASIQGLKSGESLTETLFVHSVEGTAQTITVTINGTDDKAVIGGTATGIVNEDRDLYQGQLRVDGTLTVTDADSAQNQFIATSLQGQYGTLTINDLGHWTYTADNAQTAIQGLKSGESLTETLFVHSIDGSEQKVTVSINGSDDKAVIGGTATGTVTEDKDLYHGQLRVDGALTVTDPDSRQNQFVASSLQGQYGTLIINDLGHWTYTADNAQAAIQGLKSGDSLTETLFVHSVDGSEQKVTVTINGTDDRAVIGGAATGAVTEDRDLYQGQLRVDGALTVTDADSGQNQFIATSLQGQYGTLTINDLGHWTYTADNAQPAIQGLKSGKYLSETLMVHSLDGTEQTITIKISGQDDAAVITGEDKGNLKEDYYPAGDAHNTLHYTGSLDVHDPDKGESYFRATHDAQAISDPFGGSLDIEKHGVWQYVVSNNALQHLGKGQFEQVVYRVYSADGTSKDITITLEGTNDAPVVSATKILPAGQEDTQMRLTPAQLLAHAKDIDDNDAGQLTVANLQADHGTITTNPDGSFTFTPEKDYNGAVHFTYDVKDAHGGIAHAQASTTLAAMSDQAQVSGDTHGELVEDQHPDAHNQIAISGQLNVQDPDAGQAGFQAGTATQVDDPFGGSLHIGADGSWTYDVDNARLQQLSEHQEVLVTHRVYTLDGTAQDIVIKITGTNDAPKLGVAQLSSTTGHLTVQDPDNQDSHSFSVAQQTGQFGTLVVDPDTGAYSYHLNQSVAGMHYDKASGQYQGTDTFEVRVSDNHGGSETKFISFDARVSLTMPTGTGLQPQLHATVTSSSQLVDTKPQLPPTQTIGNAITLALSHASDTGASDSDGITHDSHPVVEGQTDIPFSLVTLYEQGNKLTSLLSDAQGHYSVALSGLSEGAHQISASAQAPGSQQTVQATPLALTLDTQTDIAVHSASLNGHGELVVQVYLPKDSELTQLVISSSGGGQPLVIDPQHHDAIGGSVSHPDHQYINFEHIDLSSLPDGELTISVRGQDVAGNQASASSSQFNGLPLSLNTNIPPLTLALTHDTGKSSSDGITTDASLTIGGQLAGMRVEYSIDGGQHWQSQFTPVQGHNQLWVRQTDAFGHASPHAQLDFELDNQAPLPQIRLDAITPDNLVNAVEAGRSIAVTGSVNSEVPGGTPITLAIGQQTYQGQVDNQGHFSVQVPGSELAGAHEINASLTTTDLAGNQGSATENHQYQVDTQASIDMNPIAGDNMLQAGEQHQALTISGTVTNVEEGQRVTVSIGGQQYHANVHNGCWSTQLSAAEVDALPGGSLEIKAMVSDLAGNQAQMSSPLYVVDHANPIPSMSFLTPPTPTGTGAIGSHISGDLIAPPLLQQLTPNAPTTGAWAIDDGHGHPTLSLRGQYGTLTIDPDTGHVDYVYNQAPTPGDKAAGGTHWAGETTSETHHDIFHILYHDSHSSNVDVEVNLDITYVHGHSGHNQLSTQLVDMTVTPVTTSPAPPPPPPELHDTPQWDDNQEASDDAQVIVIQASEGEAEDRHARHPADQDEKPVNHPHELAASGAEPSHTEADARPLAAAALAPVDHYLQMVGLSQQDLAQVESHTKPQPDLETPLMATEHFDADDLTLTPADQFDNPLLEEHEKEKPHPSLVDIDDPRDDQHASAHDDELLHNALNDMHNQF